MAKRKKTVRRRRNGDKKNPVCETSIKIVSPPPPDKITAGSKTIDVRVEYSAQLSDGTALADCIITVMVEKIDLTIQKVVDARYTRSEADSPAKDKRTTIAAGSDMNIAFGNGVRITATLVCDVCRAISNPVLSEVRDAN
jgi:hypothetical protein